MPITIDASFSSFSPAWFDAHAVIVFYGVEYQPLLMNYAREAAGRQGVMWESALTGFDDKFSTAAFEQLFLGDKKNYWLGDVVGALSAKQRRGLKEYIEGYKGPHTLILFYSSKAEEPLSKKFLDRPDVAVVNYEALYSFDQIAFLQSACFPEVAPQKMAALKKMVGGTKRLALDVWLQMLRYVSVTSMKALVSGSLSFYELIPEEYSLFDLATHFFKRDTKAFYELWKKVQPLYPDVFWISYWSDVAWRAYHATSFMKAGNYNSARKYAYRLPFAYLQYQWKTVEPAELKVLLEELYKADYAFKRGALEIPFELLWASFLTSRLLR